MNDSIKVRLKAGHPHAGETGYLQVEDGKAVATMLAGSEMYKVTLEDCQHGVEACFATERQLSVLRSRL